MKKQQSGFTLIEIAIVLVIIGLLLGGVLKGQELITAARVRNLISNQDGIKAAYFGFLDRFRALPGDYTAATTNIANVVATAACGNGNGDGDGRIETANQESVLAWEHLSKAGFINGTYTCAAAESNTTTPANPYAVRVQLIFDNQFGLETAGTDRHNLKTGGNIPVDIIAEVDRKVDDGAPLTGAFQFSDYQGNAAAAPAGGGGTAAGQCHSTAVATTSVWNATNGTTNCGGSSLF